MAMTDPPLLAIALGRKARARKTPPAPQKEIVLQMAVADLLRRFCSKDWAWTHPPLGEIRDKSTATKLKRMGSNPGWPDILMIDRNGRVHCLELKRTEKEDLNDNQEKFQTWCVANGVPYVVAWTMDQVLTTFEEWGCLTIEMRLKHG